MKRITLKFLAILAPVVLLAACGDGGTTSTGTAGTGGGGTGGGGTGGTGGGTGGTGGGTGGMMTGGTGGMMTGSGGSGGMMGSGGSGMMAMGQCINDKDGAIIQDPNSMFQDKVTTCGTMYFGAEPKTLECIKMVGFTDGCAQCFDDTIHCVIMNCAGMCAADPGGQACSDCRKMFCDEPFAKCSGLMP